MPKPSGETLGILGGAAVLIAIAFALANTLHGSAGTGEPGTTLLLTIAIIIAVLALAGTVAIAFQAVNLSNHEHALALPAGSVRAIIALSLVITFISLAVYLFAGLGSAEEAGTVKALPFDKFNTLLSHYENTGFTIVPVGTVTNNQITAKIFHTGAEDARREFAEQIFTTIATVLVAVVGFYFGAKSTTSAAAALRQMDPRSLEPPAETSAAITHIGRIIKTQRAELRALKEEMTQKSTAIGAQPASFRSGLNTTLAAAEATLSTIRNLHFEAKTESASLAGETDTKARSAILADIAALEKDAKAAQDEMRKLLGEISEKLKDLPPNTT